MGIHTLTHCIFTNLPVNNYENGELRDAIEYILQIDNKKHLIRLNYDAINWNEENSFFKDNKYIFESLLYNDNWFEDEKTFIDIEKLKELLLQKNFPKTPQQKVNNLFNSYLRLVKEAGQLIAVNADIYDNYLWKGLYFKSLNELNYYTLYLHQQNYIKANFSNTKERSGLLEHFYITIEGLNHHLNLQSEGENSDLCFIAMAFRPETKGAREAIKSALSQTGFKAIIIDEQNIDSDKTINDEIIANLKKCKFCIADFSYHSNGVYFESGFALGQGKKVIYTCIKDEFEKAHFDIRPLQHIIYSDFSQLEKDLINKIEAWIK